MWLRRSGDVWRHIDNVTLYGDTDATGTDMVFNWTSQCIDVGTNYFKFNATDTHNYTHEAYDDNQNQFEIYKRNVDFEEFSGDNEQIDREYNDFEYLIFTFSNNQ